MSGVPLLLRRFKSGDRNVKSYGNLTSCGSVNLSGNVASLVASKKYEDRGHLGRLRSASKDSLRAEIFGLLLRQRRRDQWSPHGPWGYGIDAHASLDCKAGQRAGKAHDGGFG